MTSVYSCLITMFAGLFWLLRLVVSITNTIGINFPIIPINSVTEIILLFVTIICLIFIVKRNIFGALVYFIGYGYYFGTDLFNRIVNITNGGSITSDLLSLLISFFGVLIPFLIVIDIFLNKDRSLGAKDKKTEWFYKGKQYDRKFDDRADRNQYKF